MPDYMFTLPFLCGLLWAIGGREGGRYVRRIGVGLAVGFYSYIYTSEYVAFASIFTYWIVTSIGYGKIIAKRIWPVVFILGVFFGLASVPVTAITGSQLIWVQSLIAGLVFTGVTYWSNTGKLKPHWALAEGFTGIGATILIPYMIIA